jgi:hypothetical protein
MPFSWQNVLTRVSAMPTIVWHLVVVAIIATLVITLGVFLNTPTRVIKALHRWYLVQWIRASQCVTIVVNLAILKRIVLRCKKRKASVCLPLIKKGNRTLSPLPQKTEFGQLFFVWCRG